MTEAIDAEDAGAFEELMAELSRPSRTARRRARRKRTEAEETGALPCGDLTCPCRVRPTELRSPRYRGR